MCKPSQLSELEKVLMDCEITKVIQCFYNENNRKMTLEEISDQVHHTTLADRVNYKLQLKTIIQNWNDLVNEIPVDIPMCLDVNCQNIVMKHRVCNSGNLYWLCTSHVQNVKGNNEILDDLMEMATTYNIRYIVSKETLDLLK